MQQVVSATHVPLQSRVPDGQLHTGVPLVITHARDMGQSLF